MHGSFFQIAKICSLSDIVADGFVWGEWRAGYLARQRARADDADQRHEDQVEQDEDRAYHKENQDIGVVDKHRLWSLDDDERMLAWVRSRRKDYR